MTKDALEAAIKTANLWSGRSTLILALGILGEYVLLPFLEKKPWLRPAKIFFAILVVAGIVGEYEFSAQISQHADELQRISDGELREATDKAGAAIERSGKLETANKQLGIALEAEKQKTAGFQKEADVARLALETDVRKMSARYKLVYDGRDQILAAASPFMGQRVEVQRCGPRQQFDEIALLIGSLVDILTRAKWDVKRTEAVCSGIGRTGVFVAVNEKSSESTITAGKSLAIVLEKLLWGDFARKEFDALVKIRESPDFPQGPWAWLSPAFPENPPLPVDIVRLEIVARQP